MPSLQQHSTHSRLSTHLSSSSRHYLHLFHHHRSRSSSYRIQTIRCSSSSKNGQDEDDGPLVPTSSPAEQFAPLASTFQRRILTGVGTAALVAVGADFGGITSFLLGLSPEIGRNLKLDVLYPIGNYMRCVQPDQGFEFIYPAYWVGDQTLLYRAARKAERERAATLDQFPPLNNTSSVRSSNEPVVAFGPPGSSGELNVSVVVSQVPIDFRIEAVGGPEEVGKMIIQSVTNNRRGGTDEVIKGILISATRKEEGSSSDGKRVSYYEVEFKVESPRFQRHNIAVCSVRGSQLYTLNAQASELVWPQVENDLYMIANSFKLTGGGGDMQD